MKSWHNGIVKTYETAESKLSHEPSILTIREIVSAKRSVVWFILSITCSTYHVHIVVSAEPSLRTESFILCVKQSYMKLSKLTLFDDIVVVVVVSTRQ